MTDIDPCAQADLLPFETALHHLLEKVAPIQETEALPLPLALNRIIANDVFSPIAVPGFDNSAMDGYACRTIDLSQDRQLTQVGESFAGAPFIGRVNAGECVRIMTGAQIPKDTDTVVMQENTRRNAANIEFLVKPNQGDNIRLAGTDIMPQQQVLSAGDRLKAADLGLLSSLGVTEITVFKKLKVAVFSTGDELVESGGSLAVGQIYDSNRITTLALLSKLNIETKDYGIVADSPASIEQTLHDADQWADLVITSGGVSVGDADHVKSVINAIGQLELWRIAIKPGKPFAYGKLPQSHFVGLPGNPVSALVTLYQIAIPMVRKLQGAHQLNRKQLTAITQQKLRKRPGRKDFQRGILSITNSGEWQVSTTGSQSSGVLSSMAQANCFIVLEATQGSVAQYQKVTVELFDELLS